MYDFPFLYWPAIATTHTGSRQSTKMMLVRYLRKSEEREKEREKEGSFPKSPHSLSVFKNIFNTYEGYLQ